MFYFGKRYRALTWIVAMTVGKSSDTSFRCSWGHVSFVGVSNGCHLYREVQLASASRVRSPTSVSSTVKSANVTQIQLCNRKGCSISSSIEINGYIVLNRSCVISYVFQLTVRISADTIFGIKASFKKDSLFNRAKYVWQLYTNQLADNHQRTLTPVMRRLGEKQSRRIIG